MCANIHIADRDWMILSNCESAVGLQWHMEIWNGNDAVGKQKIGIEIESERERGEWRIAVNIQRMVGDRNEEGWRIRMKIEK